MAGESTSACARSSWLRRPVELRLGAVEIRLRPVDRRLVGARIDDEEHVALLHHGAVGEVHRLQVAGDARAHLDRRRRLEAAGELVPFGEALDERRRHRDRRGRCRRLRVAPVGIPACGKKERGESHRHDGGATANSRKSNGTHACIPRGQETCDRRLQSQARSLCRKCRGVAIGAEFAL